MRSAHGVGLTVRVAVRVTPAWTAAITAVSSVEMTTVATGNAAAVSPSGTVAVAGTVTEARFEVSATTAPPAGAAPVSVSVPVAPAPPWTLAGERDKDCSAGAPGVELPQPTPRTARSTRTATVQRGTFMAGSLACDAG